MSQAHARWLLVAGLSGSLLSACSDEADPGGGSAGSGNTSGSAGTSTQGGSASGSGGGGNAAGSGGTSTTAGSGGAAAGSGGATAGAGGSMAGGGAGGSAGASAGMGGGGGSGGATLKAVANITGLGASAGKFTGTATFTQGATMTKLELSLSACPNGPLVSHLHQNPDCGDNGNAAGNHWANGEDLGDYMCTGGKATLTMEREVSKWTIGGDAATDITKHSFMVHEGSDDAPGARVACGVIAKL